MQVLVQFIENLSNRHTKVDGTEIENMQPREGAYPLYTGCNDQICEDKKGV